MVQNKPNSNHAVLTSQILEEGFINDDELEHSMQNVLEDEDAQEATDSQNKGKEKIGKK